MFLLPLVFQHHAACSLHPDSVSQLSDLVLTDLHALAGVCNPTVQMMPL